MQDLGDWGESDSELRDAFEVTHEVVETLEGELEDKEALVRARSAETVEVREALCDLPAFLQVVRGEGLPQDAALDEMRAMKARVVEHVRWRSVKEPDDIDSKAMISCMGGDCVQTHV